MIITYAFSQEEKASEAAVENHVTGGIVPRRNVAMAA